VVTHRNSLPAIHLSSRAREAIRLSSLLAIHNSHLSNRVIHLLVATARSGRRPASRPVDIRLSQEVMDLRAQGQVGPVRRVCRPRRAQ
jgi:hypothetical protein